MPADERSIAEILQDIVHNIQGIMRAEVLLAKAEIREEARKVKGAAVLTAAGATAGLFAIAFLLLTVVYALSLVVPAWAAALIVGAVLAIIAAATVSTGLKRFKQVHAMPQQTVETLKENVEWVKQQTK